MYMSIAFSFLSGEAQVRTMGVEPCCARSIPSFVLSSAVVEQWMGRRPGPWAPLELFEHLLGHHDDSLDGGDACHRVDAYLGSANGHAADCSDRDGGDLHTTGESQRPAPPDAPTSQKLARVLSHAALWATTSKQSLDSPCYAQLTSTNRSANRPCCAQGFASLLDDRVGFTSLLLVLRALEGVWQIAGEMSMAVSESVSSIARPQCAFVPCLRRPRDKDC